MPTGSLGCPQLCPPRSATPRSCPLPESPSRGMVSPSVCNPSSSTTWHPGWTAHPACSVASPRSYRPCRPALSWQWHSWRCNVRSSSRCSSCCDTANPNCDPTKRTTALAAAACRSPPTISHSPGSPGTERSPGFSSCARFLHVVVMSRCSIKMHNKI